MSEDLTKKLPPRETDRILTAITNLDINVRSSFDNLVSWISSIDARLHKLEEKVEQRLYDTRPMWHKVVADIAELQTHIAGLHAGQEALHSELRALNIILGNPLNSST
jgi:hypothetical protein